jgi:hypothetical protein
VPGNRRLKPPLLGLKGSASKAEGVFSDSVREKNASHQTDNYTVGSATNSDEHGDPDRDKYSDPMRKRHGNACEGNQRCCGCNDDTYCESNR